MAQQPIQQVKTGSFSCPISVQDFKGYDVGWTVTMSMDTMYAENPPPGLDWFIDSANLAIKLDA